jgi:HemY protein
VRRKIVFSLAGIFLLLGILYWTYRRLAASGDAGYVIVGIGDWVLETSLFFMVVAVAAFFVLFYLLIQALVRGVRLPLLLKRRQAQQRSKRSQEALVTGVVQTTEGFWEKAERTLIRHAADSGTPLINYLTAARAAHSRGAIEQRDEYLKLARKSAPEAELAVELTRAELQIANRQFESALESLTHLNRLAPSHAAVLRLTHQLYAQMEDWEALHRLMPDLHRNKVLMEAEIRRLETDTYSALVRKKAATRDPVALREAWRKVPPHVQLQPDVATPYFAAMIDVGAGKEVEEELRSALGKDWNETLLVLYGCIQTADPQKHLQTAETWLAPHPRDPVLLSLLGKLAIRAGDTAKARDYLEQSLAEEPSVEAYYRLGELLFAAGDHQGAGTLYRKGLMLASNEVVAQIEQEAVAEPEQPPEREAVAAGA